MKPVINQFLQERLSRFLEEKSGAQGSGQCKKPHLQVLRTKIQQENNRSGKENNNLEDKPSGEPEEPFNHYLKEDLN